MDIRKLQRAIVDGLEDVKAQNIVVFNTEHLSPLFERVIIASGTSNRQTKALAASVRDAVQVRGLQVLRTEGEDNGEWIIVDCGAAVVHIMQPAIREYYHLEEIWGDKPVKMKLTRDGRQGTTSWSKAAAKTAPQAAPPRRRRLGRHRGAGEDGTGEEGAARRRRGQAAPRRPAPREAAREAGAGAQGRRRGKPAAPQEWPQARARAGRSAQAARRGMKLLVVAVGQRQPAWADAAYERLRQALPARDAAGAEGGEGRAAQRRARAAQCMAAEAQRIEAALPKGARRVVLDERGTRLDHRAARRAAARLARRRPRRGAC